MSADRGKIMEKWSVLKVDIFTRVEFFFKIRYFCLVTAAFFIARIEIVDVLYDLDCGSGWHQFVNIQHFYVVLYMV